MRFVDFQPARATWTPDGHGGEKRSFVLGQKMRGTLKEPRSRQIVIADKPVWIQTLQLVSPKMEISTGDRIRIEGVDYEIKVISGALDYEGRIRLEIEALQ